MTSHYQFKPPKAKRTEVKQKTPRIHYRLFTNNPSTMSPDIIQTQVEPSSTKTIANPKMIPISPTCSQTIVPLEHPKRNIVSISRFLNRNDSKTTSTNSIAVDPPIKIAFALKNRFT
jgi:hypothetical protein